MGEQEGDAVTTPVIDPAARGVGEPKNEGPAPSLFGKSGIRRVE